MNIFHPEPQNRHLFHFNFGNVACDSRKKSEGENHIKVAAVIAHIENRSIGRNIFLSPDNQVDPCQSLNTAEGEIDIGFAGFIL